MRSAFIRSIAITLALSSLLLPPATATDYEPFWSTPTPTGADILDLDVESAIGIAIAADGTVLRTDDFGASWIVLAQFDDEGVLSTVEVLDSGVFLVAGAWGLALRSTDGGTSWDAILGTWTEAAGDVAEVTPGFLSLVAGNGMHVSTDDGLTWTHRSAVPTGLRDQSWIDTVTAVVAGHDVWRTTDAGMTWTQTDSGPAFQVSLHASGQGIFSDDSRWVHVTYDGGVTWEETSLGYDEGVSLAVLALGGSEFRLGSHWYYYETTGYAVRLADDGSGLSPSILADGLSPWYRLTVAGDGAIAACGVVGAIARSTDGGASWVDAGSAFDTATRPAMSDLVLTSGRGYALTAFEAYFWDAAARFLVSTDNGESWAERALPFADVRGMVARDSFVYVWGDDGEARSADEGQSWATDTPPVVFHDVAAARTGSAIYGIFGGAVYRSSEDGDPWELRTIGLPAGIEWQVIAFLDDDTGFVAGSSDSKTASIYATENGGELWALRGAIEVTSPLNLAAPHDMGWVSPSVGFVGFPWVTDQDPFAVTGLARTDDGGVTWGWVSGRGVLDLDADEGGRVHTLFHPRYSDTVSRSEDAGVSWEEIAHGVQTWQVFELEPIVWGPRSVAGDANRYIVGGSLGEIRRFDRTPVAVPESGPGLTAGLTVSVTRRVGSTFTLTAHIPEAGRVISEVFDVRGRRIKTLVDGSARAGDMSFSWDGRLITGRPAAPGVYFVRVSAGASSAATRAIVLR